MELSFDQTTRRKLGDMPGGAGGFYEETVGGGMVSCPGVREKKGNMEGQPSVDAAAVQPDRHPSSPPRLVLWDFGPPGPQ
jgi:hypothetical protein